MPEFKINSTLEESKKKIDLLIEKLNIPEVEKDAAVFFDIDGTLSRKDNLEILISEVVARDLLPHAAQEKFKNYKKMWQLREVDFMMHLDNTIELVEYLKKFPKTLLDRIAASAIKKRGARYFVFTWAFLLRLKLMGYKLIAVSGAPRFIANKYLEAAGIFVDEVNALYYEFKDGIFTGRVDMGIIRDKGKFIVSKYSKKFDLKKCIALGDTSNDIPMLSSVGMGIAINPNLELANAARDHKWPVIIERKNVIIMAPDGDLNL